VQGAGLALLVQGLFLWALLFATIRQSERVTEHETILTFHPAQRIQPHTIDARGGAPVRPAPVTAAPVPFSPVPQSVPQSDLRAFGRTLFGCAPEHYAELSPEDRKHCPKPGEGLALNPPLALPGEERSRVKDNARWANALAHKQAPTLLPGGNLFPLAVLGAILDGSITERSSAFRDPEKWQMYGSAPPRERNREATRLDPSQMDRQGPGRH